jgi:hypothetical protein
MADQTYQFFTDADFKKILDTQGNIQTAVAVATNNLEWIVKNYNNQCHEIEELGKRIDQVSKNYEKLEAKYNDLRGEMIKYVGMGAGAAAVVAFVISILPWIKSALALL